MPLRSLLLLLLLSTTLSAQLAWRTPRVPNAGLPASATVHETNGELVPGVPFHAVYATVDLSGTTLVVDIAGGGPVFRPVADHAAAHAATEYHRVLLAINGGYFSATESVSLLLREGHTLAANRRTAEGDATRYPTRGAFGVDPDGKPDIGWVYTDEGDTTYRYDWPVGPDYEPPPPGRVWDAITALGGAPVLVYDGRVVVTDSLELIRVENDERAPRTAIGYTASGELILLVVDGRQPGYAEGVTLEELANIMLDLGCRAALNLDGGGSSAMVVGDRYVNRPSDAGGPRAVASALLLRTRQKTLLPATRKGNLLAAKTHDADFRMAVISDFNGNFGSLRYDWRIDSLLRWIPDRWQADFVVCGGDMIAGQSPRLPPEELDLMWTVFDQKVADPLRRVGIPFAFTLGNHDGALRTDSLAAQRYWRDPDHRPDWQPVDTSDYPFRASFTDASGDYFFLSWNAIDAHLSEADLAWAAAQITCPAARRARLRFAIGHLPLYGVANERNSAGNILNEPNRLRQLLEKGGVHTYVSGHHHAYFPGKRGDLELLNAGAAAEGTRSLIGTDEPSPTTVTLMDVYHADNPAFGKDTVIYTTWATERRAFDSLRRVAYDELPVALFDHTGEHQLRRDVRVDSVFFAGTLAVAEVRDKKLEITVSDHHNYRIDSVYLVSARHGEVGQRRKPLRRTRTIGGPPGFLTYLPANTDLLERLTAGHYALDYITKTGRRWRSQFYPVGNTLPEAPAFNDGLDTTIVKVHDAPVALVQSWEKAVDPEFDPITYEYELLDRTAHRQFLTQTTDLDNHLAISEQWLYRLIDSIGADGRLVAMRRISVTDGGSTHTGGPQRIVFRQTDEPLRGELAVLPPDLRYDHARSPFAKLNYSNGHGITTDRNGKIWAGAFGGDSPAALREGLAVYNPDGSAHPLPLPPAKRIRGLGRTPGGNVLLVRNDRELLEIDADNGRIVADWTAPVSLTNPSTDSLGHVFLTSVVGNQAFLLKRRADTFHLVRPPFALPDRPEVARAATISCDGRSIYLPSSTDTYLRHYELTGGPIVAPNSIEIGTTANSITTDRDGGVYVLANPGSGPARLFYRRPKPDGTVLTWELPLPEVKSTDLRGITLALPQCCGTIAAGRALYLISGTDGTLHRYLVPK